MVQIVYLCAGLANRMFQYAFYLSLKSKGYITKIADNSIVKELKHEDVLITDIFPNVHYEKASILQIFFMGGGNDVFSRVIRNRLKIHSPFYERTSAQDGFKKELFEMKHSAFHAGVFQSEKYFEDIKDEVKWLTLVNYHLKSYPTIYKNLELFVLHQKVSVRTCQEYLSDISLRYRLVDL